MNSQQAARLAFGNPGFFDFLKPLASGFKAVAPAVSFAAGFVPGVGPLLSKAVDFAAGAIADDTSAIGQVINPSEDDAEDDPLGNDGDY